MLKRILVANRGEIAIRIMRAAKELEIESVAIFHEIEKKAHYIHFSDYSIEIKGTSPKSAFLDIEQIISKAKEIRADAIHPGYGFLSENANFARRCEEEGIKFIGPSSSSIEAMGSKTKAREIMANAGVPIVPGTKEPIQDINQAKKIANEIGYPILLKASAGGGGKGMRDVRNEKEFEQNFESAQREALKAFGDDSIYIEKLIENPKHIEIQIIADEYGNYVYLGERDCSIQRRHQKLIEECPSIVLDPIKREEMGKVAIAAAKAVNYVNAGTIEFLFDINRNFYFLEMNTRLQVEHPVTELVTRIDLVKEQILVASGIPLSFTQDEIPFCGHAIECRINAEDVFNDFLPDTGKIQFIQEPDGNGVRIDSGIALNSEISVHFDPMLAKLISFGKNRKEAIEKMTRALKNFIIQGVKTNIPFHLSVMKNQKFIDGTFDTGFIEKDFDFESMNLIDEKELEMLAAILAFHIIEGEKNKLPVKTESKLTSWKEQQLITRRLI
jgi:acetyl-CoA carboxylase biotin carboxylase subunit